MEKTFFALSLGFVGLILATHAAKAADCGPRADFAAGLATGFGEVRHGAGLTVGPDGKAQVLELFTSETGSWTLIVTQPDGTTCLVASGQAWENLAEDLPDAGEPA